MSKICLINLGCVRNLSDAETILGRFRQGGHVIVPLDEAETLIINTCGFIEDAKQESVDAILEAVELKKEGKVRNIVVAGCLSQRYADDLRGEFPEVDAFIGVQQLVRDAALPQFRLTPEHMAYLKICESCFNHCAFCAIPRIKGKFASRGREAVLREAADADQQGVKELNIIGQDTTAYGLDLYREKALAGLLKDISGTVKNIRWLRLLYTFPRHITDDLLDVMAGEERICRYLDVPLQHVSGRILKNMNRQMTAEQTRSLITRVRDKIPQVRIRTAFITGLPGETEEDFDELVDFVRWARIDRVGVFAYSAEEGTPAFAMPDQVPQDIREQRRDRLMAVQQEIALELNQGMIGRELEVLIEGYDADRSVAYGRSEYDAPDVDGLVYVRGGQECRPGDMIKVRISEALEYDLIGEKHE
ncbi:MAG: 30S ribosomal protein S12 methylthiotransferase RimO [Candidatus Omnitrophota bacterium]